MILSVLIVIIAVTAVKDTLINYFFVRGEGELLPKPKSFHFALDIRKARSSPNGSLFR